MNIFSKKFLMESEKIVTFVRPNLSANGTMGGNNFAVSGTIGSTANAPYKAVDGNSSTNWVAMGTTAVVFQFYNPKPLNVTGMSITYEKSNYTATNVVVLCSNDGSNWTQIFSTSNVSHINLISNKYYFNYYRLIFTPPSATRQISVYEIQIQATYKE